MSEFAAASMVSNNGFMGMKHGLSPWFLASSCMSYGHSWCYSTVAWRNPVGHMAPRELVEPPPSVLSPYPLHRGVTIFQRGKKQC